MKTEDNNRTHELIVKSLLGTNTDDEREQLHHLMKKDARIRQQYEQFASRRDFVEKYKIYREINKEAAFEDFKKRIHHSSSSIHPWRLAWVAACIAIIAMTSVVFMYKENTAATMQLASTMPGQATPYLMTEYGTQITLGQKKEYQINIDGIKANDHNGRLNVEESEKICIQTLTVPKGSEYNITLPDGTEVHLNAGSVMTFPTRFGENVRKVSLKGEAYFKVQPSENNTPFIVLTNDIIVRQYGTEFNVNSYEENSTFITLLEGSIGVVHDKGLGDAYADDAQYTMLSPGEQAVCQNNLPIILKTVNTENVTGWHKGLFRFDNVALKDIAKELQRWYATDIEVEQQLENLCFTGTISRKESLAHILDAICQSSNVTYIADDGKLRIKAKNVINRLITD